MWLGYAWGNSNWAATGADGNASGSLNFSQGAATDMFYLTPPRHISTLPLTAGNGTWCRQPISVEIDPDQPFPSEISVGPARLLKFLLGSPPLA
jgi:hypothetical protein